MNFDFSEKLTVEQKDFLRFFAISCRRTILKMIQNSQSGHPGGSLSNLDFLATLYVTRLIFSGEKIVISNGHISPAVYSVLAEIGAIDKEDLIQNFRKFGSIFEGHVSRHVPGIFFGTGPLGVGISVAAGFAVAEKLKNNFDQKIFCTLGDGEMQEGQVHEAALFAAAKKLKNLVVFVDWNRVQLSGKISEILPIDPRKFFEEKNWNVLEIDGHDVDEIFSAINFLPENQMPTAVIGRTIMGYGVEFMEKDGRDFLSTWHGKTPKKDEINQILLEENLQISDDEKNILQDFRDQFSEKFLQKIPVPIS